MQQTFRQKKKNNSEQQNENDGKERHNNTVKTYILNIHNLPLNNSQLIKIARKRYVTN